MGDRWLGIPLPIWILAMAAGVYYFAARGTGGAISLARVDTFTTPPNQIATDAPAPTGAAPGSQGVAGMPYDMTAVPPAAMPSITGPGISGAGLNVWQGPQPPPNYNGTVGQMV